MPPGKLYISSVMEHMPQWWFLLEGHPGPYLTKAISLAYLEATKWPLKSPYTLLVCRDVMLIEIHCKHILL